MGSHSLLYSLPFPSSPPRDWTHVSCIEGRIYTIWTTRNTQSYSYSMPKYMKTWIFKTHISFTFHCPIFPVLFLKPPNLVFHYFPSILSMHKHACYVNHLIFCVYALLPSIKLWEIYSKYWLSLPLSWWEICFAKNCEQKCEMCCCPGAEILSLLWRPLDLEHRRCGAKFQLHTTFHRSKA